MKLRYLSTTPDVESITTSLTDALKREHQFEEWYLRIDALKLEIQRQRNVGQETDPNLNNELESIRTQWKELNSKIPGPLEVLVSRCPYCSQEIWMEVGIFSLTDAFWYREDSNGRDEVSKDSRCLHLFCVDGALNLNGYQPTEVQDEDTYTNYTIRMAAEVPFVKPRVLSLPMMIAVIHSFPVAEKYTAYPIVYFAETQPSDYEFCMPWARIEQVSSEEINAPSVGINGIAYYGKRSDVQDYELEKWIRQEKLYWLDPNIDEHPLVHGHVEKFPYSNVTGRRNPYTIKNGRVRDRQNPKRDSQPSFRRDEI
jgi:hypothetical protein